MSEDRAAPNARDGEPMAAEQRDRIIRDVQARYAKAMKYAGGFGRLRIRMRMRAEIMQRLERLSL